VVVLRPTEADGQAIDDDAANSPTKTTVDERSICGRVTRAIEVAPTVAVSVSNQRERAGEPL